MNKFIIGIFIFLAGLAAGWYVSDSLPFIQNADGLRKSIIEPPSQPIAPEFFEPTATVATATIRYTDSGFVPMMLTVTQGTTIQFINESSSGMWVASDLHPSHQLLPGFDQLKSVDNGGTYEYTFDTIGTWRYHNDMALTDTGIITVEK